MKTNLLVSLTLLAGALGQKDGRPEYCFSDQLTKSNEIEKREALCNGTLER